MTFTVPPGQVTGFIGPNGAGKSTTMRVILGLDAPDAGTALIGGPGERIHAVDQQRRRSVHARLCGLPLRDDHPTAQHHARMANKGDREPLLEDGRVREVSDRGRPGTTAGCRCVACSAGPRRTRSVRK